MGAPETRGRIIGVRFTPQERAFVEGEASSAGLKLSDYVRRQTLAGLAEERRKPKSPWGIEWEGMEQMTPEQAAAHFRALSKGRLLPEHFRAWLRSAKIRWLDRNWPLGSQV
jgi:hypothetical protein